MFGVAFSLSWAVLAAIAALGMAAPASANEKHATLIVDANNGQVLHSEAADELRYPASLTKMMTLYMAFEAIERGRLRYDTRLKVSHEAASAPPTRLDLDPGETITLIDAMRGLIVKSANDAAIVIAEHLGGTEANFARMMTAKARLIGMPRTTFKNASGLPDPGQVTTARDMVRLALRLQDDFPRHYHLFSTRAFSYEGSNYRNHNSLLYRFQGTDGIKTGYTRASGFNLVSSVKRGGRHVVGAVFGGRTASRRDDTMQLLLARSLNKASPYKTRQSAPVLVAAAEPVRRPSPQPQPAPQLQPPPLASAVAPEPQPARPRVMVPPRPRGEAVAMARPEPARPVLADTPAPVVAARPQPAAQPVAHVPAPSGAQPQFSLTGQPMPSAPSGSEHGMRMSFVPRGMDFGAALPQPLPPSPAPGAAPSTFQQQAANIARGAAPVATPAPVPAAQPPRIAPTATPLAAVQPSAATAPRAVPPPPYAVRGPMPPPAPLPAPRGPGTFEIQIGAYATATEADRALSSARSSAGAILQGSDGRSLQARKDNRQIWRARFVGFDSARAATTCLELRRRQIDCFVMRSE